MLLPWARRKGCLFHTLNLTSFFSVPICLFYQNNQESLKRAMKSKGKELLNAKSASYKSNKDLEHQNTNLKSNMLSIKKDMERIQSTHHFSIAAAVETAKLKEHSLLRAEIKHTNVSSTAMLSASYLFFLSHSSDLPQTHSGTQKEIAGIDG